MTSSKKLQNLPKLWRHWPRNGNPKLKFCFLFWTTRLSESSEDLNSSLAQSTSGSYWGPGGWNTQFCNQA